MSDAVLNGSPKREKPSEGFHEHWATRWPEMFDKITATQMKNFQQNMKRREVKSHDGYTVYEKRDKP